MPRLSHLAVLAVALATTFPLAQARGEFFIVSELPGQGFHHDSFVLPLSDPADIAHARALIEQGPAAGATIVLARIAAGADGVNRNYLAPGAPEWSWHVTEFLGFNDMSAELYDGWPSFVESDVAGWIDNTSGIIGFWGYTVTAELPETAEVPEPGGLALLACGGLALLGYRSRRRG